MTCVAIVSAGLFLSTNSSIANDSARSFDQYTKEARQHHECFEMEQALTAYTRALKLRPNSASTWAERSDVYKGLLMYDKSFEDLTHAIKCEPQNYQWYKDRASICYLQGNYKQAIIDYDMTLKLDPNTHDSGLFLHRGQTLQKLGKKYLAIVEFERCIDRRNRAKSRIAQDACINLGKLYIAKGDYDKAVRTYNYLIEHSPHSSAGYYGRALAFEQMGKKVEAKVDRARGKVLDSELDPALLNKH